MRVISVLPFAALGAAFVIPDEQVLNLQHVAIEQRPEPSVLDNIPSKSDVLDTVKNIADYVTANVESTFEQVSEKIDVWEIESKQRLENVVDQVESLASDAHERIHESYFDMQAWLESEMDHLDNEGVVGLFDEEHPHPPHPPHPPHSPHDDPDHDHPPPPPPPHHPPPHHGPPRKSNLTVYQLISESKYTTKLAKLINEYDDLVDLLNKTSANYTVFAPVDKAFEKIPEHAPKPSKEQLKALLTYHISPDFYPAGRILVTRTIPTLLKGDHLGDEPLPQRLSTHVGLRGLTVNFYARVVAVDIFGTNGVIHGVDSLIVPPPSAIQIIDLLPSEFSTLELGLSKTGLLDILNTTENHGGTLFAPSNFAFQKLGPKINAFLFSKFGLKYLTALLKYHVVPKHTLYSDAYYKPSSGESAELFAFEGPHGPQHPPPPPPPPPHHKPDDDDHRGPPHHGPGGDDDHRGPPHHGPGDDDEHRGPPHRPDTPKGFFHVDLPTMLDDRSLTINIFRYGRLIEIKINGFSRVVISDGVAQNGVIHVVGDVLIPPKNLNADATTAEDYSDMTVEEFKQRLEPFVEHELASWSDL